MATRIHAALLKAARWMARPNLVVRVSLGFLIFLIFLGGSIQYTSRPGFCTTCHYMEPFYQSWAESSHSEVTCTACHFPPGIMGTVHGKLAGLEQVVSYMMSSYTRRKPWAEIDDASCLQSGCHATRTLQGKVTFKNVVFDHEGHLGELRRGKELRCTSCHSQVVQGEHILVTETACFLCHLKEYDEPVPGGPAAPESAALGDCKTCHDWESIPPEHLADFRFDHSLVVEQDLDCTKCHNQTIVGDGFVPQDNCYSCHFEADRLEKYDDSELLHRVHISENKIECTQCHLRIQHKIERITAESKLECETCHSSTHAEQLALFTGKAAHGLEGEPNPMLEAGLNCSSCHLFHEQLLGEAEVRRASPKSCEGCHGEGYDNLLRLWSETASTKLANLSREIGRVERSIAPLAPAKKAEAEAQVQEARYAAHLLEVGKSVHNMQFADQLIGRSFQKLNAALDIAGANYQIAGTELSTAVPSECANCHAGVEAINTTFGDLTFSHQNHVVGRDIACKTCHSNASEHGELIVTKQQCNSCHHNPDRVEDLDNCATCHETQAAFYAGTYLGRSSPDVMFDEDVACGGCHGSGKAIKRPAPSVCVDCHDEEYEEMPSEWKTDVAKLMTEVRAVLDAAPENVRSRPEFGQAQRLLEDIRKGGAKGVHNYDLTLELLSDFRNALK
ncbi:MAG TPA: cytochrome c3 family protein [Rhodothermia bacterium]|nr:cytochrome c3 family protein [Rhodothermia bacterium]